MSKVKRIYVEKKPEFAVESQALQNEFQRYLKVSNLKRVRILTRYDLEGISEDTFAKACYGIFAEAPVDLLYLEDFPIEKGEVAFTVESLPGQFDQRADSAEQCIRFINEEEQPIVKTAITYVLQGEMTSEELGRIKKHCINPVESREIGLEKPDTLAVEFEEPEDILVIEGFCQMTEAELRKLHDSLALAMTMKDFLHIQNYFQADEKRDPTETEIRVLDTYWSDHCRHTTFSTELTEVNFQEGAYKEPMQRTYQQYLADHQEMFAGREDKFVCLMDLALMAMRKLKKAGKLEDQEESEEINACSIVVPVIVDGVEEEWLLNFKNETHNHPTEIEPFGGAATCLGGAIRDPLSGRTYVYQAMRITGAADPTVAVEDTMKGKLPQKKLVRTAAAGYSSYGNQIGLTTGLVKEIYHPNYVAKRMELGAVLGAAPRRAIVRETPAVDDRIILLGGRTGRDGCGGATGSSKSHTEESIETCGAEVQKGNAPSERKIQRLFRREEVSRLIKKCNDFGAGGVSVAIGELADGLTVDLDKVPTKYTGLNGTELAISESQERMAVVVAQSDVATFLGYAKEENLEAVEVAVVTEEPRLVLKWRGEKIVDLSRAFLDTNGTHQETKVEVESPAKAERFFKEETITDVKEKWLAVLKDLNVCSQKGLVEMFDASIGANTVLMPYGGQHQLTESQAMVAKIPVLTGETESVSLMSYGFDPYLSSWSPYHGAIYAVMESVAKIIAVGGNHERIRFSFQEYFRRMSEEPTRWSQPMAALLGAYAAQIGFGLPSIGGKDSMSGTFQDIDVPPTLVSFAVTMATMGDIITPELKKAGNKLVWLRVEKDQHELPDFVKVAEQYTNLTVDIRRGAVVSAYALDRFGVVSALSKMAFGNGLGVKLEDSLEAGEIFAPAFGDIVAEVAADQLDKLVGTYTVLGEVTGEPAFVYQGNVISLGEAEATWMEPLEEVFPTLSARMEILEEVFPTSSAGKVHLEEVLPTSSAGKDSSAEALSASSTGKEKGMDPGVGSLKESLYETEKIHVCSHRIGQPTVFIPIFPGTNCEYDSQRAFEQAGAKVITRVFKNMTATDIRDSVKVFGDTVKEAQILMFPGGFSAGDEPAGSAKFFATAFRNAYMKDAVEELLQNRDGLILGICNGFQALIKLGLVPHGAIVGQDANAPTLTYNTIGRHIAKMVYAKVVSHKSPWLQEATLGGVYMNPASHGEGRFVANEEWLAKLFANGQVATQYCDPAGVISMNEAWNVNGSYAAIEGITSPDGRVYGKMAHVERRGVGVAINSYGEQDLKIFESGVKYFK